MKRRPPARFAVYWQAFKASIGQIADNNISLISAGVAFFGMLSLFPALAALISVLGLIADPVVVVAELEQMQGFMPAEVYDLVNDQVVTLVTASADTLGWAGFLSLLLALWLARAGVGAMMIGLNSVYNERNRNTARHYFRAVMLTIGLVVVGIVALLTIVVAPVALAFVPLGPFYSWVIDILRYLIAVLVLFAGIGVLYRFGPNRRGARMPWLSIGAVVAVMAWMVMSIAFSYYVANFGNYNRFYGSVGAVIAMLTWLWISSFLVLFGASLNAQIELRTKLDSTIGEPKPMGHRGAYMADNLVETPDNSADDS